MANGINWLEDLQMFYRERGALEKEYSQKLTALARKYHEKKGKKIGPLSVGDMPTKTPGSLESASLTTWTTQLATVEKIAAEHDRLGSELQQQIADPIRNVTLRLEEVRKLHVDYAAKLEKERDAAYTSLKRSKGLYDSSCQELESKRKKIESSFDMSKQKAQNNYAQQTQEMHNVKNSYIISINVANRQKQRYYHEYVPDVLDNMQSLAETKVVFTNQMWALATRLENDALKRNVEHLDFLSAEIPRNDPRLDSMMFAEHNIAQWQEPVDMGFEPSAVWHDDANMITDEAAKVFLRNILLKSNTQRIELKKDVDFKRREVEKAQRVRQEIRAGRDKRDEVEVVRTIFVLQEQLHEAEREWSTAEIETATITSVVGDISIGAQNHNFKSQTFKIPTNCDLCGERIWGLSAKGFDCRDCGYTCHSKCELKVPADCPGEQDKDQRKKLKANRQESANKLGLPSTNGGNPPAGVMELDTVGGNNAMNTLSSGYATSAHRSVSGGPPATEAPAPARRNRVIAPPPMTYAEAPGDIPIRPGKSETRGKMLYAYAATGEGEVSVDEGTEIVLVEPDGKLSPNHFPYKLTKLLLDGSGWITIKTGSSTGVVPASYCELQASSSAIHEQVPERTPSVYSNSSAANSVAGSTSTPTATKKKGPAVAPRSRGAKKLHYVEALYDYSAQSDAEFSMSEGDRFVVVTRDTGDGWTEVQKGGLTKCVPANYVQDVT